jgi:histidyl-tRNA synthetase
MADLIEPRTLRGFRDYPPALMLPRERLLDTARRVYRSYGFAPIDTPALEYAEVLLGKGGAETDKQLYRFQHDRHDVALRFDLTVPFARFAAQNIGQLGTPFKRYHMGPVWRGENPQKGRYREFWQCDFDTIGTTSNASDIETALVINDLFEALGFERFEVCINNRMVLNGLLEEQGVAAKSKGLLRALDKLPKIGRERVALEMVGASAAQADRVAEAVRSGGSSEAVAGMLGEMGLAHLTDQVQAALARHRSPAWSDDEIAGLRDDLVGVTAEQAGRVLDLAETRGSNAEVLARLERDFGSNARAALGIRQLRELLDVARAAGVPDGRLRLDLSIARGLDYYTGTIYETFLCGTYKDDKGQEQNVDRFGSVCSGGRYDNLAGLYTRQHLPGVGASLGLDRLLAVMEAMGLLPQVSTPAPVLVVQFAPEQLGAYQALARQLRAAGVGVEVYPEAKKLGQQFKYAGERGFRLALIAGPEELDKGVWKIKDLTKREETTVPAGQVVAAVQRLLGAS